MTSGALRFRLRHFLPMLITMASAQAFNTSQMPMYAEQQLMTVLFENYDPNVRPYFNLSEPLQVSFGVHLLNIMELNPVSETLDAFLLLQHSWHDHRLQWNISQYQGVMELRVPPSKIWRPDIIAFNNVLSQMPSSDTMIIIMASGHIVWTSTVHLRSTCRMDLRHFPFDQQTCQWFFGSWVYNGLQMNLNYLGEDSDSSIVVDDEEMNKEWQLVKRSAHIRRRMFQCCPEVFPDLVVTLILKRNPLYYVHVFIVPALLIGLLVPFHMLLPPDSCERMTLGSVLMVSLLLLILKLQDCLPYAHSQLPAIGLFYTLSFLWAFLAMVCSIFVHNVHSRGPRRGKVPEVIRWIFLRSLKRLVCLGSDTYYLLSDMETISMRGLDPPKPSFAASSATNPSDRREHSGQGDTRACLRVEREVEEMSRQLHMLGARAHMQDSRADTVNEWHLVALVLDRVLFFIFLVIYLLCAVTVLA